MKNILIIGASSGIGKALASKLIKEGDSNLYLASRNQPDLEGDFNFQSINVQEDFELDLPEKLDGLIYCPGSINLKPFHRFKDEDFLNDFSINTLGAIKVIRQALPSLKKSEQASIVLFSTVAVGTGLSFHTSIAAAKGGLEGLARSLAAELAPSIRVNLIAPSLTNTPLAERLLSSLEKIDANANRHPLKRIGSPEDMANAASFLLSDDSSWMTGQTVNIDGGMSVLR